MTKQTRAFAMRVMLHVDLPRVSAVESSCFEYPWVESDFGLCMNQRNMVSRVIEREEKVVGFMIYELQKGRYELMNLAVHPSFRRQGAGAQMIRSLMARLHPGNRHTITMKIRETNMDALLFFKAQGFLATGMVRDYWEDSGEDAVVMEVTALE